MTRIRMTPDAPWLAPLAGYSDLAFRLLCREQGAAGCFTEMISAKGLLHASPGTGELLRTHALDTPLVVQLFGEDPQNLARATDMLLDRGFTHFDLNMGCSVPKVTRGGAGAALLRDVPRALSAARAMIAAAGKGRVGFKLRLGWERPSAVWHELGPALAEAGAGWISLHPRFARQGFTGGADWSVFPRLAALLPVPLIASGDLFTAADGLRCLGQGGPGCVMYARGALRDPAVFSAHRALAAGRMPEAPTGAGLRRIIERHAELIRAYGGRGEKSALLRMRSVVPRYASRLPGARVLRQRLCACGSWTEFDDIMEAFFSGLT